MRLFQIFAQARSLKAQHAMYPEIPEKRWEVQNDAKRFPAQTMGDDLTTRVTLTFQDDDEAERFIKAVDNDYIYERYDDRPLNGSVDDPVTVKVVD